MNNIKDTDEIITPEIVDFYNDAIIKGISSSDDTIIIKSIYLIIQLMRFDYYYCLKYYQDVFNDSVKQELLHSEFLFHILDMNHHRSVITMLIT